MRNLEATLEETAMLFKPWRRKKIRPYFVMIDIARMEYDELRKRYQQLSGGE
jgi:hypothetical protein